MSTYPVRTVKPHLFQDGAYRTQINSYGETEAEARARYQQQAKERYYWEQREPRVLMGRKESLRLVSTILAFIALVQKSVD